MYKTNVEIYRKYKLDALFFFYKRHAPGTMKVFQFTNSFVHSIIDITKPHQIKFINATKYPSEKTSITTGTTTPSEPEHRTT